MIVSKLRMPQPDTIHPGVRLRQFKRFDPGEGVVRRAIKRYGAPATLSAWTRSTYDPGEALRMSQRIMKSERANEVPRETEVSMSPAGPS
jgi:hypothetical protein